jgi:hypothetical protein
VRDGRLPSYWLGVGVALIVLFAAGAHSVYYMDASRTWHIGTKYDPGPDRAIDGLHLAIQLLAISGGTLIFIGRAVPLRVGAFCLGVLLACTLSEHGFSVDAPWVRRAGLAGLDLVFLLWLIPVAYARTTGRT